MKVLSENDKFVTIQNSCPFCGKTAVKQFPVLGFDMWNAGSMIQNAFPQASADDREFLMTGICNECFPSEED